MFKGQVVELPVGARGLTGTKNMAKVSPEQLLAANNLTFEAGTLQKEGGADKYNSTAISGSPSVLGGHDWHPDTATQRDVVLGDDGILYKGDGTGTITTTLKSGLTVTAETIPIFVEGGKEAAANNRKLFVFTGANVVQVLSADGATTSDISTPPADWSGSNQPFFGLIHEDRLWGGGNLNDPHRLYYGITTDHEDMTGSGSGTISIFPGEGQRLLNAFSYKGLIIAVKDSGVYAVDTTSPTIANWKVSRISKVIGPAWIGAITPVENDFIFLDQSGSIRLISSIDEFGNVGTQSLGDIDEINTFLRDNLNFSQTHKWRSIYYSHKREVHFAVTGLGATTNNGRLVVDLNQQAPKFRFSDRDTAISLWLRIEDSIPRLVMGDDVGFVWKMDRETRSKDGSGYEGRFQSSHDDFSRLEQKLGTVRKNGRFLELVVEPKGNWNLNVDIIWDGSKHETVQFNMGTTGAALGSFILGTNKLAGGQVLNKKRRITGGGRRFSIDASNSADAQDFSVARFFLHFAVGDESLL